VHDRRSADRTSDARAAKGAAGSVTDGREGHFHALDARTGELLWKASLGGQIVMAPITYMVDGRK